jgi:DNA-binding NarL/FixJ family response regulator
VITVAGEPSPRVTVCFVERNPLAMDFLRTLVARHKKVAMCSLETRLEQKSKGEFVVVIDRGALDRPLPGYLRRLTHDFPQARRLVLDADLPDNELCSMLSQGIDGFVPYDRVRKNLLRAIHAVAAGRVWVPSQVLEHYVSYVQKQFSGKKSRHDLTSRETEVLQLLQRRLSNKEISSALRMSESTVKFHLARIFHKLGVHSRYELSETAKQ